MSVRPIIARQPEQLARPANVEAEAALIGALLIENRLAETVSGLLSADDFYEPLHGRIFALIGKQLADGKAATPLTLKPYLENDPALKELGGVPYLARLSADTQGLLAARDLAEQVADLAARRRLIEQCQAMIEAAGDTTLPLESFDAPEIRSNKGAGLSFEWAGDAEAILDGVWLIEDWLPNSGPAVIFGHPGCGKTFLALSMAAAVAQGSTWAGRRVERGAVIYVAAEGQTGFRNRLAAMIGHGQLDRTAPFAFIPTPIDLQAVNGDVLRLVSTIKAVAEKSGERTGLVVIDTLSKTFGAGKENSDDMASYVANCERIAAEFDCLTLIVHHRPKSSEGPAWERGHASLRGGVVTSILVDGDAVKVATIVKQKDGPDGERIAFRLDPVTLGTNSRGKEVTSCLVEILPADECPAVSSRDPRKALTGHAKTALGVIERLTASAGIEPPATIPADAIDRTRVSLVIASGHVSDTLQAEIMALSGGRSDMKPDTLRRTAARALSGLKDKEILGSWGEWLWLTN